MELTGLISVDMNYQCFESQLGNTLNYQETSQPYTFSTSAVSTSTVSEKYCKFFFYISLLLLLSTAYENDLNDRRAE